MGRIDVHADDFGESVHATQDILDCIRAGKLDSISVLPNMSCFSQCVRMYRDAFASFPHPVKISAHINLMEGSCLSDPDRLPDLTDGQGHFCASWGTLFLRSHLPGQRRLKAQLKQEICAQLAAVREAFPEMTRLRIDSHQHTHMIPIVMTALCEVLQEEGWEAEYIRDAAEPLLPFLRKGSLYRTYRPVNLIKNAVLHYCSLRQQKRFRAMGLAPMFLWGLIMSGNMDLDRVRTLLPDLCRYADRKNRTLEILFHPGQVLPQEITPEFSQEEAVAFHLSKGRRIEKEAVLALERKETDAGA